MKRNLRVLVIDESESDAALIHEILTDAGFKVLVERVEAAHEMREALEEDWDLICSEYILTDFSGLEALHLLQRTRKAIPVIILAGEIQVDEAMDALRQGAADCVLKENLSRFVSAVKDVLKQAEINRKQLAAERAVQREAHIFSQINDSVICLDLEGRITSWNKAAQLMRGWSAQDMVGQSMLVLFDPHVQVEVLQKFAELQPGDEFRGELEELCKDGTRIWVDVRFSCLQDGEGRPAGYMSIARDVTKLRRNVQRMRFQSSLLDQLPGAVLVIDLQAHVTYWNRGAEKLYGWRESEVIGRDLSHILATPVAENEAEKIIEETRATGSWEGEFAATHKDGTEFPIYLITSLLRDPKGEPMGIVTVSFDISHQKLMARSQFISQPPGELATQIAGVGVWEVTPDYETFLWNEQMFHIWGVDPKTAAPGPERWQNLIHEDDREAVDASTARAVRDPDAPYDIEFRIRRANDGALRNIRAMGRVVCDPYGKVLRIVGMNLDVTDIRLREKSLVHALSKEKALLAKAKTMERSKGEFLAVMSHEIRTPMNGILGFAELLKTDRDLPDSCRDYADTIVKSGETLLGILDNILDFSRLEANGITLEIAPFSPRRLIADIEKNFASVIQNKEGLKVSCSIDPSVPDLLEGDAGRLRQILLNLIGNAVKFTEKGKVTVEVCKARDSALHLYEFAVRDTGPGIPEGMRDAVFEPFVQGTSRISERYGGAGLGLAIARRLVVLMGGTLTVKSADKIGSDFRIQIPLTTPRQPRVLEVPEIPSDDEGFALSHPMDILVVDDDPVNQKLVLAILNKLGYTPRTAADGLEAVACYDEHPADLILMDIQMPHMDGYDAAERIRAIETAKGLMPCFIVAITATTAPVEHVSSFTTDMNQHLTKPIKREAILGVLQRAFLHT